MIKLILLGLQVFSIFSDCPISSSPRQTYTGYISAQLDSDSRTHGIWLQYSYPLQQTLQETGVNTIFGVTSLELNSHNQMDFNIEYMPSTILNSLKFRLQVNDREFGWRYLRFSFLATQSSIFQISTQSVSQFSSGIEEGKYSVYRPILNFNNFQIEPILRIFINGIQINGKQLDEEYRKMLKQFDNFKRFSTNGQLITYFSQALQQKKSIYLRIYGAKILGKVLVLNIQTNTEVKSLRFSTLIFSKRVLIQKHNYILGDFFLINGNQYKLTSLSSMDMVLAGMVGFKLPRDSTYSFNLLFQNYFGQSYFSSTTNYKYFSIDITFIAFELQQRFLCEDCLDSPNIFQNKYCVETCPRGYSKIQRLDNFYCQKCDIEKLKIVDPSTDDCICAKRHYLDNQQDVCRPCNYDCMTCNQNNKCLTCDNNLLQTKRKLNSMGRCECPSVGFYDNDEAEDIVCQKCDPKCLTCNGSRPHDCVTCPTNKQLDSLGFCVCKNGYTQDFSGNCVCVPPSILYNNICLDIQSKCNQDQVEQYIQLTRRCICKPNFIQVGYQCIRCGPNSIFDNNELRCRCINNTVMKNGQCLACEGNQVYDSYSNICICKAGTFKSNQGSCVNCPKRMAYLNGKCECIFNYFQSREGVCQRCESQRDGPKCRKSIR